MKPVLLVQLLVGDVIPLLFANYQRVAKTFFELCVRVCCSFLSSHDKCKYCLAYLPPPTVSPFTQPLGVFMWQSMGIL